MKKLICAKEIEELHKKGSLVCFADGDTIVTPSARDAAKVWGIDIRRGKPEGGGTVSWNPISDGERLDSELFYSVLKKLMEQGKLEDFIGDFSLRSFDQDRDGSGLKVVRGSSVKMDVFDTGTPGTNVHFQELVSKEESKMSAGFLEIDRSRFAWDLTYEEIDYVIEGTLIVEINGTPYTAQAGDVVFVPSGSSVFWQSPDKAKVFYSTYPANWADLPGTLGGMKHGTV